MSDEEVIGLLKNAKQEKGFTVLYGNLSAVKKLVLANSGKKEDAEDIFQESLIILFRKVTEPEFKLSSSLKTYHIGICKFLWKTELRKRKKLPKAELETNDLISENEMEQVLEKEKQFKLAEDALALLGSKCIELLKKFYYELKDMKQIAKLLGFNSEKTAKQQKYKCMERARTRLEELQKN